MSGTTTASVRCRFGRRRRVGPVRLGSGEKHSNEQLRASVLFDRLNGCIRSHRPQVYRIGIQIDCFPCCVYIEYGALARFAKRPADSTALVRAMVTALRPWVAR
jgi:hypothetical protein